MIAGQLKKYVPAKGYDMFDVPARATSRMYDFGSKVETIVGGKRKVEFACLATDFCQEVSANGVFVSTGVGSSTKAPDHLRRRHGYGEMGYGALQTGVVEVAKLERSARLVYLHFIRAFSRLNEYEYGLRKGQ